MGYQMLTTEQRNILITALEHLKIEREGTGYEDDKQDIKVINRLLRRFRS